MELVRNMKDEWTPEAELCIYKCCDQEFCFDPEIHLNTVAVAQDGKLNLYPVCPVCGDTPADIIHDD